jgi:hypothetical protein
VWCRVACRNQEERITDCVTSTANLYVPIQTQTPRRYAAARTPHHGLQKKQRLVQDTRLHPSPLTDPDWEHDHQGRTPDLMQDAGAQMEAHCITLDLHEHSPGLAQSGQFAVRNILPPAARTRSGLQQNLLWLLQGTQSPASLSYLIRYHAAHPAYLRSTASYNYLIALAMQHAAFGTARKLTQEMAIQNVSPNQETAKLIVRYYVRTDQWARAYREVIVNLATARGRTPRPRQLSFDTWLELFSMPKRGVLRAFRRGRPLPPTTPSPRASEDLQRALALAPPPPPRQTAVGARVLFHVSRSLIWAGEQDAALRAVRAYLASLPKTPLHGSWRNWCMRLVHLFIPNTHTTEGKRAVNSFFRARKIVESLLETHPSLRPSSTTLFLLLGNLRRASTPAFHGRKLVTRYRQRFGTGVVDSRVRQRLATFFVKEKRYSAAIRLVHHYYRTREWLSRWKSMREVVGGPERGPAPVRYPIDTPMEGRRRRFKRWPRTAVYRARSVHGTRWWRLLRRYHRHLRFSADPIVARNDSSVRHG